MKILGYLFIAVLLVGGGVALAKFGLFDQLIEFVQSWAK